MGVNKRLIEGENNPDSYPYLRKVKCISGDDESSPFWWGTCLTSSVRKGASRTLILVIDITDDDHAWKFYAPSKTSASV